MKYFWNLDNESDILINSELNSYVLLKKDTMYSLNGTSYYILNSLNTFDGKSLTDCIGTVKNNYVISEERDISKDIELCLKQLVEANMVIRISSDDIAENLLYLEDIKAKIKNDGFAVLPCYEWYGKFKEEQSANRIVVETSFEYFFENIADLYDELKDEIEEETEENTRVALFLHSKKEINTFRTTQLKYLKNETNKFGLYDKFVIGKVLFPRCIANIVPKLRSSYSLRNEGNDGSFIYDFDTDTLKIVNCTAAFVIEAMSGNTVEEIVIYCLERMKEFDGYVFEKCVFDVIDFIWNLKAEGVVYFE